jgi:hypothetical protein
VVRASRHWWREVQHARGDAGEPTQAAGRVQVGDQGQDAGGPQFGHASGRRRQGDQPDARMQQRGRAQADVAAADDQDALPAEARGQRAGGSGD